MPSRKQRRRREKLKRHEWEEVFVDEEGRELPPEEAAELKAKPARESSAKGQQSSRTGRHVDPPSWRRTFKRGLLFFPLMLITIFLIAGDDITVAQKVVQTLVLMAFFLPFSYFMDSVVWRSHQRRIAKSGETKKR